MVKGRLRNLDIIKICAAFAICFHHYQQCFEVQFNSSILNNVLPLLGFFVELFFMISGFFAARTYKSKQDFKCQYLKKFLRLYPYALITVIVTAIIMILHYAIFGEFIFGNHYSVPGIITSFLMVNQGWVIEYAPALNNPIWYICVLLWLYLLYYIIEHIFTNRGGSRIAKLLIYSIIAIIGGIGWRFGFSVPFLYISDCRGYATFFIGVILYEIINNINIKSINYIRLLSLGIVLMMACVLIINRNFNWYVWVYIICPSIIIMSITLPQVESKNIEAVCESTFQLYLWHVPSFYVFQFVLDLGHLDFIHSIFSMVLTVSICFVVSVLVYFYIDVPISEFITKKMRRNLV